MTNPIALLTAALLTAALNRGDERRKPQLCFAGARSSQAQETWMAQATALFCPDLVIDPRIWFELEDIVDRLVEGEDPPRDGTPES
jgi:hypothetical protein